MLVYRIALVKYAQSLKASGRAARWNPNEMEVIYTASSISLACLENVVHRNLLGLDQLFRLMTIEIGDEVSRERVLLKELTPDWKSFENMSYSQKIGEKWIRENKTCILQVPSSIIEKEVNYLINPNHSDFKDIHLLSTEPFLFDKRIKGN